MHLGFDAKRAFQNSTGLGNYARDVLRILAQQRPGHRYVAYGPRLAAGRLADGVAARGPDTALGRMIPSLWRTAGLAGQLARDRVELFHGLSGELPLGLERAGVRGVVTVHDLIFERFPELYPALDRRIYSWKSRRAVRQARLVIAISRQTRDDLVALYGLEPSRVRVVYQGCHPAFQAPPAPGADEAAARRLGLPARYLLQVGTVERRKNLGLTVRALAQVPGVDLLVVGRETPYAEEIRAEAQRLGVGGRLRFLRGVETADLATLYRRCAVALYPSRYEGFGIPIVEALSCGAPVVTTRGGVFPEAGGPGSAYVDPDDADALAGLLGELLQDGARRAAMRATGLEFARTFRDEAVAGALFDVYREALA
jgi:glycosyltransferase involved in cell wall biosynthesis